MEKYYEKYEQRYKAVYAAGADQWGYTPDDATLNAVLRLRGNGAFPAADSPLNRIKQERMK